MWLGKTRAANPINQGGIYGMSRFGFLLMLCNCLNVANSSK